MLRQTTQSTPVTALYARLSKDDEQQGDSVFIENQKRILETYARDNGLMNYRFSWTTNGAGRISKDPALSR